MVDQKLERPPGTPFMRPPLAQRPLWHRIHRDRSLFLLAAGGVLYGFLYRLRSGNPQLPQPSPGVPSRVAEQSGRALLMGVAGSR